MSAAEAEDAIKEEEDAIVAEDGADGAEPKGEPDPEVLICHNKTRRP